MANSKITWSNQRRKLSELVPWARNPRQINKRQAERLVESFDQFGQVETIAVGPDNQIYNGHQRLNVLKEKYGDDYEVEVRVASRALTEKEREKLTVFLHKGAAGDWDFDMLANEFELDDLLEWGFEPPELDLDMWAPEPPEDVEPQIDKAEELREKWGVKSGDLWQLGNHKLICGDCTDKAVVELVMGGEKADAVITDPPYGIGIDEWDKKLDVNYLLCDWANLSNSFIAFFGQMPTISDWHQVANESGMKFLEHIVWVKRVSAPSNRLSRGHEEIFIYGLNGNSKFYKVEGKYEDVRVPGFMFDASSFEGIKRHISELEYQIKHGKKGIIGAHTKSQDLYERFNDKAHYRGNGDVNFTNVWSFLPPSNAKRNKEFCNHPTEKPVEILERLCEMLSCDNQIIYDPFLGSGTTLIACERLGRKCRAIELSPAYCAVAIQRWVDVTGKEPVLLSNST